MKRYSVALLLLSLVLVLASFVVMWTAPGYYQTVMPFLVLYFTIVTALEHYAIVKSTQKSPRTSVKNFMAITVGVLLLHLIVMCTWLFTHLQGGKLFIITFFIGYVCYLVFETIALVLFVKHAQDK